jgi:hypothetical protein
MSTLPTSSDVLRQLVRSETAQIHTTMPGFVESYDAATQTATVRLNIRFKRIEDGVIVHYDVPILPNVPVAWPGGDGYSITFPLAVGDPGLVLFAERSIDEWKNSGPNDAIEPAQARRHNLSDAIFVPQLRPTGDALGSDAYASAAMVIRAPEIRLGDSSAAQYAAMANLVDSAFSTLRTELLAHTHPTGIGPSGPPIGIGPTSSPTACTKVKVV